MVASPLPDRDRRHLLQFYVWPKLSYVPRFAWAFGLMAAGLVLQLVPTLPNVLSWVIGPALLAAGNLLLLVRGYSLKPSRLHGRGKWEKTTRDRFIKMRQMEEQVKRWDESITDLTCATGAVALVFLVLLIGGIFSALSASSGELSLWAPIFVVDAVVLLLPHWITGTRRGWRPVALRQQIDALQIALDFMESFDKPACQIQPMFEMIGKEDHQVPKNARVFVRFPDGPEDFYGLQLQVTLNDVQGTKYPYLYAVLVSKKSFPLEDRYLSKVRRFAQARSRTAGSFWSTFLGKGKEGKLTVTSNPDDEVNVIVIRQHTTKQSGYHTKALAIRRIVSTSWAAATEIVDGEGSSDSH